MTILHLLPSLSSGGVEQVVLELCEGLQKQGLTNIVISAGGDMVPLIEATGAKHIIRPIGKKSPATFLQVPWMAKFIQSQKIDILHLHSRVPAWVGYLALKLIPKKNRPALATSFHGFHSVNAYSAIMTKGDSVIAVSRCMREHILQNYPQCPDKSIEVIPNSVDTDSFNLQHQVPSEWMNQWQRDYPEIQDHFTLCLPGRITRIKGAEHLLPLLQAMHQRGIKAHAVIVGEVKKGKEAYKEELVAQFRAANLEDYVTWTGHRRDLIHVLSVCDVTLSLTLQPEAFGKTTLEALALGRPVAGYAHGGVSEQLDLLLPEGNCPLEDDEAMADKLSQWHHKGCPQPLSPIPAPYRREDMIAAHLKVYQSLQLN